MNQSSQEPLGHQHDNMLMPWGHPAYNLLVFGGMANERLIIAQ